MGTSHGTPKKKKDWRPAFLKALAQTGNVSRACGMVKVVRRTAYKARESESEFQALWDEAIAIADEFMEGEARRRAVEGTLRPVFQGGKLVGKVREYSDTLMIFLLKAHNPKKYRENVAVEHSGATTQTHIFLPAKDDGSVKPTT